MLPLQLAAFNSSIPHCLYETHDPRPTAPNLILKAAPKVPVPQGQLKNIKTSTTAAVETMAALQSLINKQALPEGVAPPTNTQTPQQGREATAVRSWAPAEHPVDSERGEESMDRHSNQ